MLTKHVLRDGGQRPYIKCCRELIYHRQSLTHGAATAVTKVGQMGHWPQEQYIWGRNINLLKSTGHVMHQQFNIQQLYVLPTLYLCVLFLSENKQRLVPLTA